MRARTPSQTVGPFFDFCLTPDTTHGTVFPDSRSRIRLTVRVLDGAGDPVPDAIVEIWQACDVPGRDAGFGRLGTREDGSCEFDTVRPCDPPEGAAHVNVCLFARGLLRHLYTRLYFEGDPLRAPLYKDVSNGLAPAGIINAEAEPIIATGAIMSHIPMVDRIDIGKIPQGAFVEMDADAAFVNVLP